MDVDGVDDNGTASDELVDAEIEGTDRFGGLGEFFTPWDLQERKEINVKKMTADNNIRMTNIR